MGHLLGTGLLSTSESALIADRLLAAELSDAYGPRTYSSVNEGYERRR
jgi:glycogen debranching enzyme